MTALSLSPERSSAIYGTGTFVRDRRQVRAGAVQSLSMLQAGLGQRPGHLSSPISFAAWRTLPLRGSVVVGSFPHLRANGWRPRADCHTSRQVSLGRFGCKGVTRAADIQIHSGLRGAGSLTLVHLRQKSPSGHSKSFHVLPVVVAHVKQRSWRSMSWVTRNVSRVTKCL